VCVYTNTHTFFSIDEHLGCFPVLAVIKLQWTWQCRYLFELLFLFPLDKYPEVKFLDHMVVLFLIFWGSSILFSIVAAPIYILFNSAQGSLFSTLVTHISCLFDNNHSNDCVIVVLICISLILVMLGTFSHTSGHLCVVFKKCLFKHSVHF